MTDHELHETRTPATMCWHCDRMLDAAAEITGTAEPTPGAVSLCLYCGAVGIFGPDLVLQRPTAEELDNIVREREFRRTFANFSWARQYIMIKESLMRQGKDPDR
jgi:hypothetical protein